MAGKIGEEFFKDMVDRGRREIGGLFFHDSNIAQPNYPFRGGYSIGKEIEALSDHEPSVGEALEPVGHVREEKERDDRDMDRE